MALMMSHHPLLPTFKAINMIKKQPIALNGFINPLKAHEGHYYLHPCVDDVIDVVTFIIITFIMIAIYFPIRLGFGLVLSLPTWALGLEVLNFIIGTSKE